MTLRSLLAACTLLAAGCSAQDHPSKTPSTVTAADATRARVVASPLPGPPPLLAPMEQGTSTFEMNVTTTIRRSVLGDNSLSTTAKNVKILTVGTRVTLRGLVKTETEKTRIAVFAWQPTGVTEVDNQLEVGREKWSQGELQ